MVQCYSTSESNVSSHEGTLALPGEYDWTCASFGTFESTTETANGSVQPFLHSLRQKVPMLYNKRPYQLELPLPMGDLDVPCNTWCFGPMRAHNPNDTSIGSAVFAQITAECPYTGLPVSSVNRPVLQYKFWLVESCHVTSRPRPSGHAHCLGLGLRLRRDLSR